MAPSLGLHYLKRTLGLYGLTLFLLTHIRPPADTPIQTVGHVTDSTKHWFLTGSKLFGFLIVCQGPTLQCLLKVMIYLSSVLIFRIRKMTFQTDYYQNLDCNILHVHACIGVGPQVLTLLVTPYSFNFRSQWHL